MLGKDAELNLFDFDISPERGFLPDKDPLTILPKELSFMDEFGNNLPELIEAGKVNSEAKKLPIPSDEYLKSLNKRELQLAWVRYTFTQSACVFTQEPPASICPNIARPVWIISKILDKPPILSYDAYVLYNWKRKDRNGPVSVDNLELIQTFMRDPMQAWFILIHTNIEYLAGQAIGNLREAVVAAKYKNDSGLELALLGIDYALDSINFVMRRMPEGTSPHAYHKIRRWIMSFKNVIYEGVGELGGQPQNESGQTGAQTSIFPSLEAGLQMPPLEINELATFLKKMRGYMPRGHREFIFALEQMSEVRTFIISSAPHLAEIYNSCVDKICDFLETHYGYAVSYIFKQTTNSEGTGGSTFMTYLSKRLDERRKNAYVRI